MLYLLDWKPPSVSSLSPADNATNVAITTNLVITFDETVRAGTGTLTIRKASDDSDVETITVSGALLSGNGTTELTFDPSTTLAESTDYYIVWNAKAFKDTSGNYATSQASTTYWNFTTTETVPPTVQTFSPADNATGIATTADLVLTFSETIGKTGTGYVTIYKASDDSIVEQINTATGAVTGSGSATVTINPTVTLENSIAYYVKIDAMAFPDAAGNFFTGIDNATTWNFTTIAATAATPTEATSIESPHGGGRQNITGGRGGVAPKMEKDSRRIPPNEEKIVSRVVSSDDHGECTTGVSPIYPSLTSSSFLLRQRICQRIDRRFFDPSIIERINRRLQKRYGWECHE